VTRAAAARSWVLGCGRCRLTRVGLVTPTVANANAPHNLEPPPRRSARRFILQGVQRWRIRRGGLTRVRQRRSTGDVGTHSFHHPVTPPRSAKRDIVRDLQWGLSWGLFGAFFFSCIATAIVALSGKSPKSKYGLTLLEIIQAYFAAGLLLGLILGWLRPLTERRWGAILVGALAGTTIYTTIGVAMWGVTSEAIAAGLVLGIPMGGLIGNREWKGSHRSPAA
jgi:hypothetical protein